MWLYLWMSGAAMVGWSSKRLDIRDMFLLRDQWGTAVYVGVESFGNGF